LALARYTNPKFESADTHIILYKVLDMFAKGQIKKLRISMPAQHGKSEGSTRNLPAYLLGLNPSLKIGIAAYNDTVAKGFNRDIKEIINKEEYQKVFPNMHLAKNEKNGTSVVGVDQANFFNTTKKGSIYTVGMGGALTSMSLDIAILDDLYKGKAEAFSPVYRKKTWDWYTSVVRTRLHNNSQELMLFTRWHEDDAMGRVEKIEKVIYPKKWSDLENIPRGAWVHINFPAIKVGEPFELDMRKDGEVLWESKHDMFKLMEQRNIMGANYFECMMQGNPTPAEGFLYDTFKVYKPNHGLESKGRFFYCDVADSGDDATVCIFFDFMENHTIHICDVVWTKENTDKSQKMIAMAIIQNDCHLGTMETNNGGRAFIYSVQEWLKTNSYNCKIQPLHQTANKEGRINNSVATVQQCVYMPIDWQQRWPRFYTEITTYKAEFAANEHDDSADALTGVVEISYIGTKNKR
jgi:predicted phage terminase large subunit-like protein